MDGLATFNGVIFQSLYYIYIYSLNWAFPIKICPLTVVVVGVGVVVVNLFACSSSTPELVGQYQPTWYKASLGQGYSSLFKRRAIPT